MNTCPHCQQTFLDWVQYHQHLSLEHAIEQDKKVASSLEFNEDVVAASTIRVYSSGRSDLKRVPYTGPMSLMEKSLIVARGEVRLGLQHFIGN